MATLTALEQGRASFERREWARAHAQLSAADNEAPLEPGDLEQLATVAYLLGRESDAVETWARAHAAFRDRGNPERAARCAFRAAIILLEGGEPARGSGWLARARRLLEDLSSDCVEQGYLLLPDAIRCIESGEYTTACATFRKAADIGSRFGDADLVTLARHGEGRALIRLGDAAGGIALLDEAMLAVTTGEVSPMVAGDIYCGVISACHEIFDIRRAQEWTAALGQWCEEQPDLVAYRGQCLVRRAELMQHHGEWPDAMGEIRRACEWLARSPGQPGLGLALYQQAELHRLRGELARAEDAYREASRCGRNPQPGLALLRLARGEIDDAATAIRRTVEEAVDRRIRSRVLAACAEIMLAANDVAAARAAADELSRIAAEIDAPFLHATSAHTTGAVLLAEGDARNALVTLRGACALWYELQAPYEVARTRVVMALACRAIHDEDAAALELDAARRTFEELGAATDLTRLAKLHDRNAPGAGRLTGREVQVLGLVAEGKTNRAIARELGISEKTVARHLSNIFTKLDVPSRAAATAYAYEHDIVDTNNYPSRARGS